MRAVVYTCDRCGTTIDTGRALVVIGAGPMPPGWPANPENGRPTLDLCPECMYALTVWLRNRPAARPPAGTADREAPADPTPPRAAHPRRV
jgi:hypothetical protein